MAGHGVVSQEEQDRKIQLVAEAKEIVERDGLSVRKACEQLGIKQHLYYYYALNRKNENRKRRQQISMNPNLLSDMRNDLRAKEVRTVVQPDDNQSSALVQLLTLQLEAAISTLNKLKR